MRIYIVILRTARGRSWEKICCASSDEEAQQVGVILERITRIPLESIIPVGDDMPKGEMRAMHAYALKGIRAAVVGDATPATKN